MPIHEYRMPDGTLVERIFLHGEEIPDEIMVEVLEDDIRRLSYVRATKAVSQVVFKFKGSFSGGTASKDRKYIDDGTVIEPGRKQDVKVRAKEIQTQKTTERQEYIKASLAEYDL